MHLLHKVVVVGAICGTFLLSGCISLPLPEPTSPGSSLLIMSLQFREKVGFTSSDGDVSDVTAYVQRVGPDGSGELIKNKMHRGKYLFFPNVEPGTYEIVDIERKLAGGTNTAQVASTPITISTKFSERRGSFKFTPDIVKNTAVFVAPCSIVYMGEFSGVVRMPLTVFGAIDVSNAKGQRTPEAEKEALDFVASTFPDSGWKKCRPTL